MMDDGYQIVDGPEFDGYISEGSSFYDGDVSLIEHYEEEELIDAHNNPPQSDSEVSDVSRKRKVRSESEDSDSFEFPGPSFKRARPSDVKDSETTTPEDVHIIAHCPIVASLIERLGLARGVRYELARLVSTGKLRYDQLTEDKLVQLQGPNATAVPKILEVFFGERSCHHASLDSAFAKEIAAHSPWAELDKEEEALSFDQFGGLGNNANHPGWYGGKIRFYGRLQVVSEDGKDKKNGKRTLKIVLEDCALWTSFRHARRWGSWSFLRVKVPSHAFYDAKLGLDTFFKKTFVIWGLVFRACYAMGDNVFFYWTNELYDRPGTIPGRLSFEEFIQWHNPLACNGNQLMNKWSERIRLGFSNSVPGPRLETRDFILEEPDIVSEKNSDMTDGCGFSTRTLLLLIRDQLSLSLIPTAFQFRLAGYKGLLTLRDDPAYREDKLVWVRPSQTKIRYPPGMDLDPAMLTIDVLRTSHMSTNCTISNDIVINLAENGVPHNVFEDLLRTSITEFVKGLTTWEGPNAMLDLWVNVERAGGVLVSRRAREAVGEARVRGYKSRSPDEEELDENYEDEDDDGFDDKIGMPRSTAWWGDEVSGCPSSLEETIMVLLEAGFTPQTTPILREKLKQSVIRKIENKMKKLSFRIEESCTAFAIPDPFGVLGPDEVQIKSSSHNLKGHDGMMTDIILGDVLVTRNPCKNPCDVRKVKAVEHPLLSKYHNIIVFSTKGDRRLIDFLGGGDYDGDIVTALWALAFLLHFRNADEALSTEPAGLDACFNRETEKVSDFNERIRGLIPVERTMAFQKYLLGALRDTSLVGKYSVLHDNAIYQYGYSSYRTIKLSAKFCRVLDAPKTGYIIKPETLAADTKMYGNSIGPLWKSTMKVKKGGAAKSNISNLPYTERDRQKLGPFIMDSLRRAADKEQQQKLQEMEEKFSPLTELCDETLIAPWKAADAWAERGSNVGLNHMKRKDLALIAIHVQNIYQEHKKALAVNSKNKDSSGFTGLRIEDRQDRLRTISRKFHSGPPLSALQLVPDEATLARWRASYAYMYDAQQHADQRAKNGLPGWSRFPWNVALRDLCLIKASASPAQYTPMINEFARRMKLPRQL